MQISPCKSCTTMCGEENMCDAWREWYAGAWDRARYSLGVKPPRGRKARGNAYIYEIRDTIDGSVICRGSAEECAAEIGVPANTIRRNGQQGRMLRQTMRVTRLEVGGDEA